MKRLFTSAGCPTLVGCSIAALQLSCASTNTHTVTDTDRKHVIVYSTADKRSPLEDASKDETTKQVIEKLRKRVQEQPKDLNGWLTLSQLYTSQARFEEAEGAARKALRLDIKNSAAKKVLAQVAVRRNQPKLATIILNGIEGDQEKDADILNTRALIALASKEPAQALAMFQRALKLEPSNLSVRMNLGVAYLTYRQLGPASIQFERVLKIMPDHVDALLHMAVIRSARGEYEMAEKIYGDILAKHRSNPLALFNLAVLKQRKGEMDDALANLKTYLKSPDARGEDANRALALIEQIKDVQSQNSQSDGLEDEDERRLAEKSQKKVTKQRAAKVSSPTRSTKEENDPEVDALEKQLIE